MLQSLIVWFFYVYTVISTSIVSFYRLYICPKIERKLEFITIVTHDGENKEYQFRVHHPLFYAENVSLDDIIGEVYYDITLGYYWPIKETTTIVVAFSINDSLKKIAYTITPDFVPQKRYNKHGYLNVDFECKTCEFLNIPNGATTEIYCSSVETAVAEDQDKNTYVVTEGIKAFLPYYYENGERKEGFKLSWLGKGYKKVDITTIMFDQLSFEDNDVINLD